MEGFFMYSYKLHLEAFNPEVIMNSGQVFRMTKENNRYIAITGSKAVVFQPLENNIWEFTVESKKEQKYWNHYFDFSTNYTLINDKIESSKDSFLQESLSYSQGMIILNQDLWETIVSFIISQQNNIPKIRKTINILCAKFGEKHHLGELEYYSFPSSTKFANLSLENLRDGTMLGYRAEYILKLANDIENNEFSLKKLTTLDYKHSLEYLMKVRGIGPKVANCICLYGLHKLESCPIDTWMNKIITEDYHMNTQDYLKYVNENFSGYQGYIQQLQFYYKRFYK